MRLSSPSVWLYAELSCLGYEDGDSDACLEDLQFYIAIHIDSIAGGNGETAWVGNDPYCYSPSKPDYPYKTPWGCLIFFDRTCIPPTGGPSPPEPGPGGECETAFAYIGEDDVLFDGFNLSESSWGFAVQR